MFFKNTLQLTKAQNYARLFTTEPKTWLPKKRVSRLTMDKIRALNASQPEVFSTVKLSEEFKLSVEAIRRILKSKYQPSPENAERQERNRYEAMGERRSQFQNEYNANKKAILNEYKNKDISDNTITKRKEVKDTWRNENITRAGWKPLEFKVKDSRTSKDSSERKGWSESQSRRSMADELQDNTRRSRFSRDRDGNDSRWRNDNYNNKERRSDRPFDDRNDQRERRSYRPFEDRKRESRAFRGRDDNNGRRWRNDDNEQRNERSDRPFDDRRRGSFRDRDDDNGRRWRNDSNDQRERLNSRVDSFSDDKRRNESFKVNDRRRENGWRDGRGRKD